MVAFKQMLDIEKFALNQAIRPNLETNKILTSKHGLEAQTPKISKVITEERLIVIG